MNQAEADDPDICAAPAAQPPDVHQQLQAALAQLDEERRFRTRFLSSLAHELRNPLASLRSGFSLLQRVKGSQDALAAQVNPLIDRQLSHLMRLMDEVDDLARARAGQLPLHRERLSLQSVAEAAAAAAQPLLSAHVQSLHVDAGPSAMWVEGDAPRLAQALTALLQEASRHAPSAGAQISLAVHGRGGSAMATVAEHAGGLPQDGLQPPRPEDDLLHSADQAPGVSLSLARLVIELHGGRLWAQAHPHGLGRVLVAALPLAADGPVQPGA
ncbi:sensor histidine kinase [Azohydromonas lata]|uniref:sensor histidine kinase n=1 Tax=Azohydromonas lata TaxID=45677 RepID=UPI0012F487DC|nr:HAMP domain-containing sensor histidine kinase [Azohydromonas lata]